MKLTQVSSSSIAALGHNPATSELHVQFNSGATHIYSGVSAADHAEMLAAPSIGQHFHANIRGLENRRAG